ncbi:MAG: GerMN domain-containing protein, partial [Clostridia bacterium]|nr:GerMN domain-containing protein [Clostridia bacterium]
LSARRSGGTVVVNLSREARGTDTLRELFIMRQAIISTLCGLDGINYVDVLIAGRAEPAFSLPSGAGWEDGMTIPARWSQGLSEDEMARDSASSIARLAVIYHPARGSRYVIPEARVVAIEGGDALSALLAALNGESGLDPALKPVLPDSDGAIITGAEIVTLADGRRVARLTFDGNLSAILERGRLNAWQMYAALTCTFTGFLPELDGIQVYVGSGQLARVESPDGEITLENGVMPRALFERTIGCLETIYMTASDGSLRPLGRAMSQEDALSPRMLLAPLFGEPQGWEEGVSRVVPDGLTIGDLLGILIENGEVTLNVSASFYAGCQRLNSQQERNLVFALVNTLTEQSGVRSVRFQVEGERVDVLVHDISLLSPLMRNPGLISDG